MEGAVTKKHITPRSVIGLNAINFFQAEMVGVVLPALGAFLKEAGWRYDSIGIATALAGLGTCFCRPSQERLRIGFPTVASSSRRRQSSPGSASSQFLSFRQSVWIDGLLFMSGAAQSLFAPLLGALALALVGHEMLNRTAGINQGWNHAGNIAAAVTAMVLVRFLGISSIFYAVGISSLLAAASVFLIKQNDLDEHLATGLTSMKAIRSRGETSCATAQF